MVVDAGGKKKRAGLHERGRFKYAFARGISGLWLLGQLVGGERPEEASV